MNQIIKILMERDGLTPEEAREVFEEGKEAFHEALENGDDPEEVFMDYFGLEPDYIFEVM